jgi:hypothetical protein
MPTLDPTASIGGTGLTSEHRKGSRGNGASGGRQQGTAPTATDTEEAGSGSLAAALAGMAGRFGGRGGSLPIAGAELIEVEGPDFEAGLNAEEQLLAL